MKRLADKIDFLMRNMNVRKKLLINFYIVSLTPLLIMSMLSYYSSAHELEKELGIYTIEITQQVENRLDSFMRETERIGNMIRLDTQVQEFLSMKQLNQNDRDIYTVRYIRQLFASIGNQMDYLMGVFLVNDFDVMASDATRDVVHMDYPFRQESWFRDLQPKGMLQLIPVHPQNYVSGSPVVTFADKIVNFTNYREKGTLFLDFSPSVIDQMSENIKLGQTGYVFALTADGHPVTPTSIYPSELLKNQDFMTRLHASSGQFTIYDKGEKMLVGFSTVARTGWKIIGIVPFKEVASGLHRLQLQWVMIWIFSVIIIFIISTYFSAALTNPLKSLEQNMLLVEKGDFTAHVSMIRSDEIGRLGQRFNQMVEELNRLKEEVYSAQIKQYKLKLLSRESELAALQAQINPHFLYNTLNTMTCMAEVYDIEEISQMSKALARMFKYSVNGSNYTVLEEELAHIEAYLQIMRSRYPDTLSCRIVISEDIKKAKILKLIIQPLVENAFIHGLRGKEGLSHIQIRAYREEEELCIIVTDDGVGMSSEQVEEIHSRFNIQSSKLELVNKSIGLHSVNHRLQLVYEGGATMRIESVIDKGTTVVLRLPYQ
jgi:two-component system sensor histidine kinase YesM